MMLVQSRKAAAGAIMGASIRGGWGPNTEIEVTVDHGAMVYRGTVTRITEIINATPASVFKGRYITVRSPSEQPG